MSDQYLDRLIHAHLDNCLTEVERVELESILLSSDSSRKRFWELAEVHGMIREAADDAWGHEFHGKFHSPILSKKQQPSPKSTIRQTWRKVPNRSIIVLAFGVLLGGITTGAAWAVALVPSMQSSVKLLIESFEFSESISVTGVSQQSGHWSGDYSRIVRMEQDIEPINGQQMLRFLRADYEGKNEPEGSYMGDVFHLIDLRTIPSTMNRENAVINAAANFNMIPLSENERFYSSVSVFAFTADMIPNIQSFVGSENDSYTLAMTRNSMRLDNDTKTWQSIDCELKVPPEADFLLLKLSVSHDHKKGAKRRITFAGHYLDDVKVTLTSRTSTY